MVKSIDGVITKKANTRETFTEQQIADLQSCTQPETGYLYICEKFLIFLENIITPKGSNLEIFFFSCFDREILSTEIMIGKFI